MRKDKAITGAVVSVGERTLHFAIHIFMIILCVTILGSFLLVVGSSLQSQSEILSLGYRIIPKQFSLEAYKSVFSTPKKILDSYWVTFYTTAIGAGLGVFVTAGFAYAISRKEFRYHKVLNWANIITMLFNGGMVATYIITTQWFGLKNNMWVLILPSIYSPWNIILMKSFFSSIPNSIVEAARIDGASEYTIFFKFVVPMSKPVIATIALFLTLTFWNDYQSSLLYITDERLYKLQYLLMKIFNDMEFLNSMMSEMMLNIEHVELPSLNVRMAVCVIAAGPMMFIFPFFQKYFTKGINLGGVKG